MPPHTAILPSIGLLLGAIWEMSGKLKRLLADSMLDNAILKDLLGKV